MELRLVLSEARWIFDINIFFNMLRKFYVLVCSDILSVTLVLMIFSLCIQKDNLHFDCSPFFHLHLCRNGI